MLPSHKHAKDRAPVVVTRDDGRTMIGRLVYMKGEGRTARCKVQLASGAWAVYRREQVDVVEEVTA